MDYEKILEEQMNNVIDPEQAGIISEKAGEISGSIAEEFTMEKILEATMSGESIFKSQQLIDGLKSLVLYEIRAAPVLGVEILIICIIIGLVRNLSSSFGKKSMSDSVMETTWIFLFSCQMRIFAPHRSPARFFAVNRGEEDIKDA